MPTRSYISQENIIDYMLISIKFTFNIWNKSYSIFKDLLIYKRKFTKNFMKINFHSILKNSNTSNY